MQNQIPFMKLISVHLNHPTKLLDKQLYFAHHMVDIIDILSTEYQQN